MLNTPPQLLTLLLASAGVISSPYFTVAANELPSSSLWSTSRVSFEQLLNDNVDQPGSRSSSSRSVAKTTLHERLHDSHGVLRITVNDDFKTVRKRALSHLCTCPTMSDNADDNDELLLQYDPTHLQQIKLPDGTVRRTLASATIGFDDYDKEGSMDIASVFELPSWVKDKCGQDAYDSLEELRDIVASVTDAFVTKLDKEQKEEKNMNYGQMSYRSILRDANHLEHFHVYTKAGGGGEGGEKEDSKPNTASTMDQTSTKATFDYHTDAGFFLSFVPAMDCHTYKTDDSSFYLKGETKPLTFEEDEVVILMGAGAQYWLTDENGEEEDQSPFLAASHALRLKPNTHRAWYGKMHLMPSSAKQAKALIVPSSANDAKYGEVFPDLIIGDYMADVPSSPVDGCGTTMFESSPLMEDELSPLSSLSSSHVKITSQRRRLQHVNSPENCNNVTKFFCWYQCIDIPNPDYAEDYVRDGYSLYCLDPSILASSDENSVADATEPCKAGFTHNSNCHGSWQTTDVSAPRYELPDIEKKVQEEAAAAAAAAAEAEAKNQAEEAAETAKKEDEEAAAATANAATYPVPTTEEKYCYGGTSMYMDGFNWFGSTCVIFLFPSWVLSTRFKFGIACFGAILFGVALELVLYKRRTVYALPAGYRRLVLSALVYGLQLTMGYFIMLLVMTYSGPLFVSCVSGMLIGHVLFNAQDSLIKKFQDRSTPKDEKDTARRSSELSSYQNGDISYGTNDVLAAENGRPTEKTTLKGPLRRPSGATPCCQYTMEDPDDTAFMG
ncbi:hypothetical protein ACHAWC_007658 [Mediolabrus comicus]